MRLVQGDFEDETVYSDDPTSVAAAFASSGASWIHVVDLDAALTGEPRNRSVIGEIARALDGKVRVQTGGGVRSESDAEELLAVGVTRVVVGTAAFESSGLLAELCTRWPGQVVAGVDHRGGEVRLRGWTEGSGVDVSQAVAQASRDGAAAAVVTDISKDGRMAGPDLRGLAELLEVTDLPIVASGGVSGLADIEALAALRSTRGTRLQGVIVGKAIYEGKVDVAGALQLLATANR